MSRSWLMGLSVVLGACGSGRDDLAPPLVVRPTDAGSPPTQPDCGATPDGPGSWCGTTLVPIDVVRPNLYFVLDRSGSMGEQLEGSRYDKYTSARFAIRDLLQAVGHRVNYGGAVFPGFLTDGLGCTAGAEVFATERGDPLGACEDPLPPTALEFQRALSHFASVAGTPLAPTLQRLLPTLRALPGRTVVILATDGAPNCNPDARCGPEDCLLNQQGATVDGKACEGDFNCCDPEKVRDGQYSCVDRRGAEAVVAELRRLGIPTFVVGMPGSEEHEAVLEALAEAGGTARDGSPGYYAVTDDEELGAALLEIGSVIAVSCTVTLAAAPRRPELVNVSFDERPVPRDEAQGWAWTSDTTLELRGAACAELAAGDVQVLRVLEGCPTKLQ